MDCIVLVLVYLKKFGLLIILRIVADQTFGLAEGQLSFWYAWMGIICYTFQIYFDFSGYADMAIGLSRMMGFKITENFNNPYISQNITEFWRRWHISLSSWMRDYLYIPLGGNRCLKVRNYINLWTVFLVSGLWHGANWTFVIWGSLHGFFIVCDKLFWLKKSNQIPKFLNIAFTFLLVMFAWVFFRADNISHALYYLSAMFDISGITNIVPVTSIYFTNSIIVIFVISLIITFIPATSYYEKFMVKYQAARASERFQMSIIVIILFVSVVKSATSSYSPFIYFRF